MINILIVDDREDARALLKETIEEYAPSEPAIKVLDTFPLDEVDAYASYIREHDISVLLLDERLNEKSSPQGKHNSYYGHDVIEKLRNALPEFPVYLVTTYNEDPDVVAKAGEFEDIVERDTFQKAPQVYMSRISRAATRFLESMQKRLADLNELTMKAASGNLSDAEQTQLDTIRTVLGLPFTSGSDLMVSDLIVEARALADRSEELIQKIKAKGRAA